MRYFLLFFALAFWGPLEAKPKKKTHKYVPKLTQSKIPSKALVVNFTTALSLRAMLDDEISNAFIARSTFIPSNDFEKGFDGKFLKDLDCFFETFWDFRTKGYKEVLFSLECALLFSVYKSKKSETPQFCFDREKMQERLNGKYKNTMDIYQFTAVKIPELSQ